MNYEEQRKNFPLQRLFPLISGNLEQLNLLCLIIQTVYKKQKFPAVVLRTANYFEL